MDFPFKSGVVNTLVHATEDEQRVLKALHCVLPSEVEVRRVSLKGHHGNPIASLEARVGQKRVLRELWQKILKNLQAGEMDKLKRTVRHKIDDRCYFYTRFDKQLAYSGELMFTESGDAIHLRLKVTAFPAKREIAVKLVEKFIFSS